MDFQGFSPFWHPKSRDLNGGKVSKKEIRIILILGFQMRLLLCLFCLFFCFPSHPAQADSEALIGSWVGGDTASMSIYGTLHINSKTISWGGHNKYYSKCQVGYIVVPEEGDIVFEDQVGSIFSIKNNKKSATKRNFHKDGTSTIDDEECNFTTYLLKIRGGKCANGVAYFRLTFPFEGNFTYLAVIEYDKKDHPIRWRHFHGGK
ncbi:MAG: hypothetical protein NTW42_08085 [Deltaproteobacteria bacterium]|nr:hypothetical protein [Deltaproteobacteria bacterium]